MGDRPGACPEPSTAATKQCWLWRIAAQHHLGMECLSCLDSLGAAVRLTRVDASDGHTCCHELLVHPQLGLVGIGPQGGRIQNPGLAALGRCRVAGREEKRRVTRHRKHLAGQNQVFLRLDGLRVIGPRADRCGDHHSERKYKPTSLLRSHDRKITV